MIIQCAQCSARFRLDDSKVKEAGIKVRCSKCKHIFVVKKETPVEEGEVDLLLQGLASPSVPPSTADDSGLTGAAHLQQPQGSEPATTPPAEDRVFPPQQETFQTPAVPEEGNKEFFHFADGPGGVEEKSSVSFETSFSFEEPGENGLPPGEGSDQEGSGLSSAPSTSAGEWEAVAGEGSEEASGSFPGEEISFGEVSPEAFAAATDFSSSGAEGAEEEEISFEFQDDEATGDGGEIRGDDAVGGDIDFGEIDFGIDDAETKTPSADVGELFASSTPGSEEKGVAGEKNVSVTTVDLDEAKPASSPAASVESEPPPLSIPSRRKGKSLLPVVMIAISVLAIVALAGFGFYYFKEGPAALAKLGGGLFASWFGLEGREEGSITIQKVSAAYAVNFEGGEVLVIRGEAVNNYRKPRASIQVRASVLGSNGQTILQKVAYCGNSLTDEQIRILPISRIESAMANQFGDSLSNLGVQPGKSIPFVIVMTNVPQDAVDYTVEVAGSTVASQ